jgi:hypothetical protein
LAFSYWFDKPRFLTEGKHAIVLIIPFSWGSQLGSHLHQHRTAISPIHELPCNIVINNFYSRLSGRYKDYLDACFEGPFTSKEVEAKLDLLETIQRNIEDWDCDKGKESGINYEYDCMKSFAETADFQELSAKYGLDPHIMVDC